MAAVIWAVTVIVMLSAIVIMGAILAAIVVMILDVTVGEMLVRMWAVIEIMILAIVVMILDATVGAMLVAMRAVIVIMILAGSVARAYNFVKLLLAGVNTKLVLSTQLAIY